MAANGKTSASESLREGGAFDLTPMIDCVFQLIIFFMLTTQISDISKPPVALPEAVKAVPDVPDSNRLTVTVREDGRFEVMGRVVGDAELDSFLEHLAATTCRFDPQGLPAGTVMIRADRATPFGAVEQLMSACVAKRLSKMAFATRDGSLK